MESIAPTSSDKPHLLNTTAQGPKTRSRSDVVLQELVGGISSLGDDPDLANLANQLADLEALVDTNENDKVVNNLAPKLRNDGAFSEQAVVSHNIDMCTERINGHVKNIESVSKNPSKHGKSDEVILPDDLYDPSINSPVTHKRINSTSNTGLTDKPDMTKKPQLFKGTNAGASYQVSGPSLPGKPSSHPKDSLNSGGVHKQDNVLNADIHLGAHKKDNVWTKDINSVHAHKKDNVWTKDINSVHAHKKDNILTKDSHSHRQDSTSTSKNAINVASDHHKKATTSTADMNSCSDQHKNNSSTSSKKHVSWLSSVNTPDNNKTSPNNNDTNDSVKRSANTAHSESVQVRGPLFYEIENIRFMDETLERDKTQNNKFEMNSFDKTLDSSPNANIDRSKGVTFTTFGKQNGPPKVNKTSQQKDIKPSENSHIKNKSTDKTHSNVLIMDTRDTDKVNKTDIDNKIKETNLDELLSELNQDNVVKSKSCENLSSVRLESDLPSNGLQKQKSPSVDSGSVNSLCSAHGRRDRANSSFTDWDTLPNPLITTSPNTSRAIALKQKVDVNLADVKDSGFMSNCDNNSIVHTKDQTDWKPGSNFTHSTPIKPNNSSEIVKSKKSLDESKDSGHKTSDFEITSESASGGYINPSLLIPKQKDSFLLSHSLALQESFKQQQPPSRCISPGVDSNNSHKKGRVSKSSSFRSHDSGFSHSVQQYKSPNISRVQGRSPQASILKSGDKERSKSPEKHVKINDPDRITCWNFCCGSATSDQYVLTQNDKQPLPNDSFQSHKFGICDSVGVCPTVDIQTNCEQNVQICATQGISNISKTRSTKSPAKDKPPAMKLTKENVERYNMEIAQGHVPKSQIECIWEHPGSPTVSNVESQARSRQHRSKSREKSPASVKRNQDRHRSPVSLWPTPYGKKSQSQSAPHTPIPYVNPIYQPGGGIKKGPYVDLSYTSNQSSNPYYPPYSAVTSNSASSRQNIHSLVDSDFYPPSSNVSNNSVGKAGNPSSAQNQQKFKNTSSLGKCIMKFGDKVPPRIKEPGCFSHPKAIDILQNGYFVVLDSENCTIQVFSQRGTCKQIYDAQSNIMDIITWDAGTVALLKRGEIGLFNIEKYTMDDIRLKDAAFPVAIQKLQLSKTECYFVVAMTTHITMYSEKGKIHQYIPNKNSPEGFEFRYINRITVDKRTNNIVVLDREHKKVFIFSHDGHFKQAMETSCFPFGPVQNPQGLCVDRVGNVLVADTFNHRVLSLSVRGVKSLIQYQPHYYPTDLVLTGDNRLVISMNSEGRPFAGVRIYDYRHS